ncbi:MFS transporter [Leptolyngbya sp. FACHB-17]|uniref:MFS transporter n=1 Tax=unclassified Leptolyngbya TaxID=2650499 RepID=UPI001F55671C|nr:MFS transporter [Leptolyngbya sp. FACHB-17]
MRSSLVWMMAIASGATVANLYYNQPLLAKIAQQFGVSAAEVGVIPMLTQIGYAIGILFIVPLGDRMERRRLIVLVTGCAAIALLLAALSTNLVGLSLASFAIGASTIAAQILVPFAAQLCQPEERGKIVGRVMGGLFIGILVARTLSGFAGEIIGWQAIYGFASGATVLLAIVLAKQLPRYQSSLKMTYPTLLRSMLELIQRDPILQATSWIGAMSFGAFSAFWSTLVFLLEQPPYQYGSDIAGLFGFVGIAGAVAAVVVGKIADRRSPGFTLKIGVLMTIAAFLVVWAFGKQLGGLVLGAILLDLGVQTSQISNQATLYSLPAEYHSRLNALYITLYFVGGAIGSYLGTYAWNRFQWSGVCAIGFGMMLLAGLGLYWRQQRLTAH